MQANTNSDRRMARTALLFSPEQINALRSSHVMVFGLGGVGSYAAEALGRMGVGKLTLVDKDRFEESNINRQLCALASTVGQSKVGVTMRRLLDINPDAEIVPIEAFHLPETPVAIAPGTDMVVDAVDTVAAKLDIIAACAENAVPVISCMGMGNRLDPTQIRLGDVFDTSNCSLSRVMRKELRKRGITKLRCVYSTETAVTPAAGNRGAAPGSVAYVPSVAGLYMAYDVVATLLKKTVSGETS